MSPHSKMVPQCLLQHLEYEVTKTQVCVSVQRVMYVMNNQDVNKEWTHIHILLTDLDVQYESQEWVQQLL